MKLFNYILIVVVLPWIVFSCIEHQEDRLFISQIESLEDNPRLFLNRLDTSGLQQIQALDQAERYVMKFLAEYYLHKDRWPTEQRLNECIALFQEKERYEPLLEALFLFSNFYQNKGQTDRQIECMEEAIELAKKKKDGNWLFFLYDHLSYMYLDHYNPVKYYKYQQLANQHVESQPVDSFNISSKILIARNCLQVNKNKEAIAILKSVEQSIDPHHICYGECQRILGTAYLKDNQLEQSVQKFEDFLPFIVRKEDETISYMSLTILYYKKGDRSKAKYYRNRIDTAQLSPMHYEIEKQFYEVCSEIACEEKNYPEFLAYLKKAKTLTEIAWKELSTTTFDEIIFHYKRRKDRIERRRYEKKLYGLIGVLFISIGGISGLYFSSRKRDKIKRWELAQQIEVLQKIQDDSEQIKNELRNFIVRDFEIVKKIALLKNIQNEDNDNFIRKMSKIFDGPDTHIVSLDWSRFYKHLDFFKQGFYTKLRASYPILSEKEVQLCCMLIVGFNTNEIAAIWSQSIYSVHKYKTSIRKKLALAEGSDIVKELAFRFHFLS